MDFRQPAFRFLEMVALHTFDIVARESETDAHGGGFCRLHV